MKKLLTLFFALIIFAGISNSSFAVPPTYNLIARNLTYFAPNE